LRPLNRVWNHSNIGVKAGQPQVMRGSAFPFPPSATLHNRGLRRYPESCGKRPNPPRPHTPVVVYMHPPDLGQQLRLADHPVTDWAALGRVVGARGDHAAVLRQHPADRLDPEGPTMNRVVTIRVDELHERGDGRSNSAAKKPTRRCSRTRCRPIEPSGCPPMPLRQNAHNARRRPNGSQSAFSRTTSYGVQGSCLSQAAASRSSR
jgi:hypothetical protein